MKFLVIISYRHSVEQVEITIEKVEIYTDNVFFGNYFLYRHSVEQDND